MRIRKNRKSSTIDKLPVDTKETVDQMLLSGRPYREIVEFLKENEVQLSQQAVSNYARRFLASVEQLKMSQENMRILMQQMERYPDLDITEAILRVATQNVFSAISSTPQEAWEGISPEKLLKEAGALIRAAGYKRTVDQKLQSSTEAALAANQSLLYDVIALKHPELYDQLMQVIKEEKEASAQ